MLVARLSTFFAWKQDYWVYVFRDRLNRVVFHIANYFRAYLVGMGILNKIVASGGSSILPRSS